MTKIIFNYDVYYVSDNDTFFIEKCDSSNELIIRFHVYQCGKCIVDWTYQVLNEDDLNEILNTYKFYTKLNKFSKKQFGIYHEYNGGCHE